MWQSHYNAKDETKMTPAEGSKKNNEAKSAENGGIKIKEYSSVYFIKLVLCMIMHKANGKIHYKNLLLKLNQSRWFISILCFILFPDAGRSRDRIPVGGEIFLTGPERPWGLPSLLHNEYWVFPGGKAAGA